MPYITCMISGVPKPFSAMWRTIGTTRSARGFLLHSAMSTTGRLGWTNPIAAPSAQLFARGANQQPGTRKSYSQQPLVRQDLRGRQGPQTWPTF